MTRNAEFEEWWRNNLDGCPDYQKFVAQDAWEAAVAAEREACLDWCRAYASDDGTAQKIEAAIRARGEQ